MESQSQQQPYLVSLNPMFDVRCETTKLHQTQRLIAVKTELSRSLQMTIKILLMLKRQIMPVMLTMLT